MQLEYYRIQTEVVEYKLKTIQLKIYTVQMWKIGYCNVWHAINNGIHSFKISGKSAGLHLKNRHVPTEFFFHCTFFAIFKRHFILLFQCNLVGCLWNINWLSFIFSSRRIGCIQSTSLHDICLCKECCFNPVSGRYLLQYESL